jgi:hypothetical protein
MTEHFPRDTQIGQSPLLKTRRQKPLVRDQKQLDCMATSWVICGFMTRRAFALRLPHCAFSNWEYSFWNN